VEAAGADEPEEEGPATKGWVSGAQNGRTAAVGQRTLLGDRREAREGLVVRLDALRLDLLLSGEFGSDRLLPLPLLALAAAEATLAAVLLGLCCVQRASEGAGRIGARWASERTFAELGSPLGALLILRPLVVVLALLHALLLLERLGQPLERE
jgi:hypothetical protein